MEDYLSLTDTARCLGMSLKEASREIGRADLKTVLYQGRKCYLRVDIIDWLTREFGSLAADRLAAAEQSNAETAGIDPSALLVTEMLFNRIILPHRVGTASSMLRTVAAEACRSGALYDEKDLLEQLIQRERATSTALRCGVALTHPLDVSKLYIEHSLLMLFRPPHPLPFGEKTGRLTALFFLMVFPVANEHLHILARLNRMLRSKDFIDDLLMARDEDEILNIIEERETAILKKL
ncbi:MAG: PTS sugar transporter subunit IIA [Candidatus Aegiribacteria sp.]|nr:PTS sugar transporter subunit IIA [Candidatus Aegiribacteria sp.]